MFDLKEGLQPQPPGALLRFRGRMGTLRWSGTCSLLPLSTWQFRAVDTRILMAATPNQWQTTEVKDAIKLKSYQSVALINSEEYNGSGIQASRSPGPPECKTSGQGGAR